MTFLGLLVLDDPLRSRDRRDHQTSFATSASRSKLITGDNRLVAAHVGSQVGLP